MNVLKQSVAQVLSTLGIYTKFAAQLSCHAQQNKSTHNERRLEYKTTTLCLHYRKYYRSTCHWLPNLRMFVATTKVMITCKSLLRMVLSQTFNSICVFGKHRHQSKW